MKTGNTTGDSATNRHPHTPQWSPVMKTGNTMRAGDILDIPKEASMEPGHEDREYEGVAGAAGDG